MEATLGHGEPDREVAVPDGIYVSNLHLPVNRDEPTAIPAA